MTMERNANSVLAKLMNIEKPSFPHKSHGRRRMLSENYLQNIFLVTHRKRSQLDFYDYEDESTLVVEGNLESDDVIQLSEGTSVFEGNSRVKKKLEEARCLSQDLRYDKQFEVFNMQGQSNLSLSCASALKRQKSGEAWISQEKSRKNVQSCKSHPPDRVCSLPNSPSGGKQQSISSLVRSKGANTQGRKKRSFYNDMESSAQGIAKQVTSQVKDSIWHKFTDVSESRSRSDQRSENEHEETITCLSSCLSSLENEHGSPYKTFTISTTQEAHKTKKEFAERWRARKGTTRYLSKPTLFPSAWIPRSRTRDLNLDRNWCLRPEKSDLDKAEDSNTLEEISSAFDSFSERSSFSDVGSPTYHDALMTINETGDKFIMENHVSPFSALNCSLVFPSLDNEEIVDEGIEKMGTCIILQREQLSSEASNCIMLEDRGSSFSEFCLKHQVKVNTSEPGSPVSSLEGPEACRCRTEESNQISSLPNCLENDMHGLQEKLQPTDAASVESASEGHEMVVSSDGDNEGGGYREDPQIMKNTSENRDFSYLIDVLSESGFPTLNTELESEAWRSQGHVLNPLVFDSLEKKYGKQTFWERGERKLLYDRMDSGLMEIAGSFNPTRRKTLAKRFIPSQNQEFIEEELWALLMKQEEESKMRSSKVCVMEMEWEGEVYTYLVVKEVESLLLDELLEELLFYFL